LVVGGEEQDEWDPSGSWSLQQGPRSWVSVIANLKNMAVTGRTEAEPTTQHRNEVGLAVW